jgi:hypothetical protein
MPVQLRPQGPVQLMRQQQAGGPVVPSPSRQGVIQHTVSYPQQQRYPGPSPPVRAMPGSGHQWRPVHMQMTDPMSGGASRMIRPPGGPYMHPNAAAAMQQQQHQHQQHHHQQQLLQQQQQHHHQMQQQQQVHGGTMMAGSVQAAPVGQPSLQTQQQGVAAGAGGSADLQIVYNVEYLFEEDGKEVRKVPIEMNGETIWVESVGGVGGMENLGPGGLYKSQDSIIMDLNENDGRF